MRREAGGRRGRGEDVAVEHIGADGTPASTPASRARRHDSAIGGRGPAGRSLVIIGRLPPEDT
ncbi:hypothetical protein BJF79_46250 [Actinomadura sp. CNU-125]|nr:hypothetical protein BJF79_46250 [Actinomadura sp. CNU-125]